MIDSDYPGLACVQNALANAQQIYDEQERKLDRMAAAGMLTHDAIDTLGLLELYVTILRRHRDYVFAAAARKGNPKR
jgi:hypothetical protein